MNKIIILSVKNKVAVIEKDVNEKGLRKILNYGHTLGHTIEKISNYKIPHGEAISIGMKVVNIMASQKGLLSPANTVRINNLIDLYEIIEPKNVSTIHPRNSSNLWSIMKGDKKGKNGTIQFVIPSKIGEHQLIDSFTQKDFKQALQAYA